MMKKTIVAALLAVVALTGASKQVKEEPVTGSVSVQYLVYAPGEVVKPKVFINGTLSSSQSVSVRVFCTSLTQVVLDETKAPGSSFTLGVWDDRANCEVLLLLDTQKGQTITQSTIGHDAFTVMEAITL